jgi:predicted NBD/HSP70 family sugar kinase
LEVLDRVSRHLGLALSHLANLFNPEMIVIGGDLVLGEDLIMPRLHEVLRNHTIGRIFQGLELKISSLGFDIGLKGAAALAFRQSLIHPGLLKKFCTPAPLGRTRATRSDARRGSRAAMKR